MIEFVDTKLGFVRETLYFCKWVEKGGPMHSVFQIGSKQYNVTLGSRIRVEKLNAQKGDFWTSKEVLFVQDNKGAFAVGEPFVSQAQVKARVVRHGKAKKILILKKKRRKGYRRTQGHRQLFTELVIEALSDQTGKWVEIKKKAKKSSSPKESEKKAKQNVEKKVTKKQADGKTKVKSKAVSVEKKLSTKKTTAQKSKRG